MQEIDKCKELLERGKISAAYKYLMKLDSNKYDPLSFLEIQTYFIYIYHHMGKNSKGNRYADELLQKLKKYSYNQQKTLNRIKARILNFKALTIWQIGSVKQAYVLNIEAKKLIEKYGVSSDLCAIYNDIGMFQTLQNYIDEAVEAYEKALKCFKTLDDELFYAATLNNIGRVYTYKGDIPAAINAINQALDIFVKYNHQTFLGFAHHNLGNALYKSERIDDAIENYQTALIIRKEVGIPNLIGATLTYLAIIEYEVNGYSKLLLQYQREVTELLTPESDLILQMRKLILDALVYLATPRMFNRFQALPLLEAALKNSADNDLQLFALLHTLELLFLEVNVMQNLGVLENKISKYLQMLETICAAYHSNSLAVEMNIYKADYAILHKDLTKAVKFLNNAIQLAQKSNLLHLEKKAQNKLDMLNQFITNVSTTIKHNAKLFEAVRKQEIKSYMEKVKKLNVII